MFVLNRFHLLSSSGRSKMRGLPWFPLVALLLVLVPGPVSLGQGREAGPIYSNNPEIAPSAKEFHGTSERFVKRSGKTCVACHDDINYPKRDFFESESHTKHTFIWAVTTLCLMTFAVGVLGSISVWTRGRAKSLHRKIRWPMVWRSLFSWVLFERKIFQANYWRWFNFFSISIGFILLFLVFILSVITRSVFQSPLFLEGAGSNVLDFLMDFLGAMMLVGIVSAFLRRSVFKPPELVNRTEDLVLLALLFFIISSGFVLEAFRLAAFPWYPEMRYSFVGNALAHLIRGEQSRWLAAHFYLWLLHGAAALIFIAMIPFTKIMHFATAPLTILFTSTEQPMYEFRPVRRGNR